VAVRLRPRNAEEEMVDADFGDCVELQPEVQSFYLIYRYIFGLLSTSLV
jgi:kinesin family protein 5